MMQLDHLVIYVHDLATAMETYTHNGFHVIEGGTHADGITHNALIVFEDGTYLELLALADPTRREAAMFHHLLGEEEGFTGYALLIDRDEDWSESLADTSDTAGQRMTPAGQRLEWQMRRHADHLAPFWIRDVTRRQWRVPDDAHIRQHANGVTGIAEVEIRLKSAKAINGMRGWFGDDPVPYEEGAIYTLDSGTRIRFVEDADTGGQGEPYRVYLRSDKPHEPLSPKLAHGARFAFIVKD